MAFQSTRPIQASTDTLNSRNVEESISIHEAYTGLDGFRVSLYVSIQISIHEAYTGLDGLELRDSLKLFQISIHEAYTGLDATGSCRGRYI